MSSKTHRRADHRKAKRSRPRLPATTLARQHTEELLDEALKETFPASDPYSITADLGATRATPSSAFKLKRR